MDLERTYEKDIRRAVVCRYCKDCKWIYLNEETVFACRVLEPGQEKLIDTLDTCHKWELDSTRYDGRTSSSNPNPVFH